MANEATFNSNTGGYDRRETMSADQADAAVAKSEAGTTAGKGLGSKEKPGKTPMPKQSDFGTDMKGYGEAMRKWRVAQDEDPRATAQKDVLRDK